MISSALDDVGGVDWNEGEFEVFIFRFDGVENASEVDEDVAAAMERERARGPATGGGFASDMT